MGSSIEWGSAAHCTTYVLGNMEEAGDHQTPRDENEDPDPAKIGLMFSAGGDGFCLTGTAAQLIQTLTEAITAVATYRQPAGKLEAVEAVAADLEERGASIEAKGSNGSIYSTRAEGRGTGYLEAARLVRAALETDQ